MWREKIDDVVVVEGEPAGPQSLSIRREIHPATQEPGFELCRAITSISKAREQIIEVRQKENISGCVGRQILL